jgi:hypothetical protein
MVVMELRMKDGRIARGVRARSGEHPCKGSWLNTAVRGQSRDGELVW